MAEIVNGLNKIEQITLGEAVFGNGLNERLEQIDDNFQSIITSEYLKGDSGTSFGYATFSNKLEFVNPTQIYHIITNNEEELNVDGIKNSLTNVIGKDVGEFEFTFIYEIINGKKIAKSSLPFVYYDPSIYGISQDLEQGDYSCIVIFDGEFKKLNAFPTIYYDNEDDKFYWKINGIETKLTATGPKGERGLAGAFNIVFVRKDEENEGGENECKYIIEKFLYQDPKTHGYSWIVIDANMPEEDKRIAEEVLRPGSPCIALWGEGVETVNEETGENEITSIIVVGPIILHEEENNSIYYVQVWDHMSIQHNMNASLLVDILNNIGPQGTLKGLYVPTVNKQHNYLLHTDNDDVLNISYTDNQFNPVEDSCAVRIPKLYCNDIDFNGMRLKSDKDTGILNIIGNNTLSFNGVNISYNNTCGGILYTNSHIQLGGNLNNKFNIKNSYIRLENSKMDFVGNGGSQIDFLFTNEKTKISDSEIFLLDTNIGVDNVQVSGDIGVEGNIYIGPKGASSPNPSNVYISNGTNIDCNNLNINCQDHADILIKKGYKQINLWDSLTNKPLYFSWYDGYTEDMVLMSPENADNMNIVYLEKKKCFCLYSEEDGTYYALTDTNYNDAYNGTFKCKNNTIFKCLLDYGDFAMGGCSFISIDNSGLNLIENYITYQNIKILNKSL